ncbi:DUF998 domain-containing protein [Dactylosporangium salmoneum]|uniref:DUF998 domain-containing protein n=1 Tax=Dactylosporangium salmoneum TaxID=53361 RepID=A0ABP5T711_9ACTN
MTTQTLVGAAPAARPPERPNRLLLAGLVAGPLFTVVYLLEGAFRTGYHPVRQTVSELALGPGGWVQVVNFLVAGVLMLVFAAGLRGARRVLIAIWGIGLLGAGVFVTDRVGDPPTWHGQLHDLAFSLPGFAALAAVMIVDVRRRPLFSGLSAAAFITLFFVTNASAAHMGLFQRLLITVGWLWLAVLAVRSGSATAARSSR